MYRNLIYNNLFVLRTNRNRCIVLRTNRNRRIVLRTYRNMWNNIMRYLLHNINFNYVCGSHCNPFSSPISWFTTSDLTTILQQHFLKYSFCSVMIYGWQLLKVVRKLESPQNFCCVLKNWYITHLSREVNKPVYTLPLSPNGVPILQTHPGGFVLT